MQSGLRSLLVTPYILAECVALVQRELMAAADTERAAAMQRYLKTEMPFYGVQKPDRTPILCRVLDEFRPSSRDEYEELVLALWSLRHREEKYIALGIAVGAAEFLQPESLPLYQRLIVEGAWWDFVDDVATHLIRPLVSGHPKEAWPTVDQWIGDEDMWLRRAAIICQVGARERTDPNRLFRFCEASLAEEEFFIRKAVGWALREFAKTDPEAVATFVGDHRDEMPGLTFREATKHIGQLVKT